MRIRPPVSHPCLVLVAVPSVWCYRWLAQEALAGGSAGFPPLGRSGSRLIGNSCGTPLINLFFLLALCLPLNVKIMAAEGGPYPGVTVDASPPAGDTTHTDGRGTPKLVFLPPSGGPVLKGRQAADDFLKARQGEFKLAADNANLKLISSRESLLGTHYRYRQILNGVPVEGADLIVSVSRSSGEVYQAYNNTYPVNTALAVPQNLIGGDRALDTAWNHLRPHGRLLSGLRAELVYVPTQGGFRLVYKTFVAVEAPFGYWEHQIDAVSGEVVAVRDTAIPEKKQAGQPPDFAAYIGPIWPRGQTAEAWEAAKVVGKQTAGAGKNTVNGTALVFDGDPRTYLANALLTNTSPPAAFAAAYVTRVLRDISEEGGVYSLDGPWVQIVDVEAPFTAPSTTADGQWTALRGTNAFNDAMTYFHIDQSQRYLQSLGYSGITGIQYGPIQADSDAVNGADNSYYLPANNQLSFGHGGVDDNEDSDVILHEYGHAITYDIVPAWGGGDCGAIGEGFGDYWAASYSSTTTNGKTFHPEWAFSWDGHSADSWAGRWLDKTNLTYDPAHTYVAHETIGVIPNYSDQLWSTPLFQSFLTLADLGYPRADMDRIVIESFFGIGGNPTMRDLAKATVNTAALLFPSGPHAGVITGKFMKQLILPLPAPQFIFPAGGERFTTGAVMLVQWDRQGAPAFAAARLEYSTGSQTNYADNMESGLGGWVVSHSGGTRDWSQVTTANHTPAHSWFATNETVVSDQFLKSPLIPVGGGAELSFWHSYNLESGYDGGVVEVSTNGTAWDDLGANSTQNGYNSTIATSWSSPIAGRRAFSGNSGGFIQTRIPLTAYAGRNIYLRFREANDNGAAMTGWWVDDVSVVQQWVAIGTTPTNASSYLWTLPLTPGTNYTLRIQQFAVGYADSAWVQSSPFTISNLLLPPVIQSITRSNGITEVTFSFGTDAAPTAFKLQGAGTVNGTYADLPGATITKPSPGIYKATIATASGAQFYRVRYAGP